MTQRVSFPAPTSLAADTDFHKGSPGRPHAKTTLMETDRTQQLLYRLFDPDRYHES